MKTISLALLLMACMAFVLMGCSDNSSSVVAPSDQRVSRTGELTATSLGKSGSEIHSVSGNMHTFAQINNNTKNNHWDFYSNVTLSARSDNNITSGSIHVRYIGATPPPGFFPEFSGRIIQLKVENNPGVGMMAKVMFEVTDGAAMFPPEFGPTPVGVVVVIDGGEGKNALPDCSVVWWAIDSPQVIEAIGLYDISPIEYAQLIQSMLPPGLSLYLPIENGNLQVR